MKKALLIILIAVVIAGIAFMWFRFRPQPLEGTSAPEAFEESGTRLEGVLYEVPETSTTIELRREPVYFSDQGKELSVETDLKFERSFISESESFVVVPIKVTHSDATRSYLGLFSGAGSNITALDSSEFAGDAEVTDLSIQGESIQISFTEGGVSQQKTLTISSNGFAL